MAAGTVTEGDGAADHGQPANVARAPKNGFRRLNRPRASDAVAIRFRSIYRKLKDREENQELLGELLSENFFQKNEELFKVKTSKQETLLNYIINKDIQDADEEGESDADETALKLLVQGLVQRYPEMLLETNYVGKTPLYMAISSGEKDLVQWMCDDCPDDKLERALAHTDENKANCIHAAVRSKLDVGMIKFLIDKAATGILLAQEATRGCTPLHLAVDYSRCGGRQLEVVEELVQRADQALDLESRVPQKCTVYRYHIYSRDVYNKEQLHRPLTPASTPESQSTKGLDPGLPELERDGEQNPTLGMIRRATAPEADDKRDDVDREASANAIREYIKLHYLRSESRDAVKATTWLYGENKDGIELVLDHFEADNAKEVDAKKFAKVFQHFRFDEVLKSVHFRSVRVKASGNFAFDDNSIFVPLDRDGEEGRTDNKFFFDWLRHSKGVRRILKVTVEEASDQPHSDEAIESCLEGFQVEMLDWRKIDICPKVVRKVGADLRTICLRWSGNNAVLRSWSKPEGLAQCPKLKKVILVSTQEPEQGRPMQDIITKFQERLQRNDSSTEGIRVYEAGGEEDFGLHLASNGHSALPSPPLSPDSHVEQGLVRGNTHKWLKTIDSFAEKIRAVKDGSDPMDFPPFCCPPGLAREIVVAIVDDGVDISHKELVGRIARGVSFDTGARAHYRHSSNNHGTLMARMVVRVCPKAKIFVAKMQTHPSEEDLRIDVSSAAKTIQAAVDYGVDIISMSWMVRRANDTTDIQELQTALDNARKKGILLFCSSGDFGYVENPSNWYPVGYEDRGGSKPSVFRIGAATDAAKPRNEAPDLNQVHYIFPGQDVFDRRAGRGPASAAGPPHTGSSVATALAAGLAALVIYCVKLGAIYAALVPYKDQDIKEGGHPITVSEADFKSTGAYPKSGPYMKDAFRRFGINEYNSKFINVWELIDTTNINTCWKRWNDKQKLAAMAELGQKFVNFRV